MNGTLAIWYDEPLVPQGPHTPSDAPEQIAADEGARTPLPVTAPVIDLHFNLWRDLASDTNFLDVGVRLKSLENLSRFYLYVPVPMATTQIQDLSVVLKFGQTLNAVFNTVVVLKEQRDKSYIFHDGKGLVTVHHANVGQQQDIWVEPLEKDNQGYAALIIFGEGLCNRMKEDRALDMNREQYVRIRLYLEGKSKSLFSQEVNSADWLATSSLGKLELTEFRLNEKRNYPARVVELSQEGKPFFIKTIHYFLIRDLEHQLVMQHTPFKNVRRLEGDLWKHYLGGDVSRTNWQYEKVVHRMVIYHWKSEPKTSQNEASGVEDFLAFASFKANVPRLYIYLIAVIFLSVVGNACSDFIKSLIIQNAGQISLASRGLLPTDADALTHLWNGAVITLMVLAIFSMTYNPIIKAFKHILRHVRTKLGKSSQIGIS